VLAPCHRCKDRGKVVIEPCDAGSAYGFVAYCDNCSGGEYEVSHGMTRAGAELAWNEAVDERREDDAPLVCEFCGKTATDEREDRTGRTMDVCDFCADDHDRAAKRDREEAAREAAVDMALSEWKENRGRR
jgi:hypothetical protein